MKLRTNDGREVTLGAGCAIHFDSRHHYIELEPEPVGHGLEIFWPTSDETYHDNKRILPGCIKTEEDFRDIVFLFADMLGLHAVPDGEMRDGRFRYRLTQW